MRPVEGTYGDLMGHDGAESLAWKPAMEVEGGRLDLEGGLAQFGQIEIDGMVRGRADRGRHARKHGQCRAMDMPRCDQLHAGVTAHDGREIACVEEIAFRKGFIDRTRLRSLAAVAKNEYGEYLLRVADAG